MELKNVNMEQDNTETEAPPKDRLMIVYFLVVSFGVGTLVSWNMFINAKMYFEDYKMSYQYTQQDLSSYTTNFMVYFGIASQVPNLLFSWANIFIDFGERRTPRIVYSIAVEVIVFIFTEVLVVVDTSTWPITFFWLTMISVFIQNMANGVYQTTVYGIVARLPSKYTGAVVLGTNVIGMFTAVLSITTKVLAPTPQTAALYYFFVAIVLLLVLCGAYFTLPLLEFYKYYNSRYRQTKANAAHTIKNTSYWEIFSQCWVQCFNVFFLYSVTLSIFPEVFSNIRPSNPDFFIPRYYFPDFTCFLTFHVFSAVGSITAKISRFPSRKWLTLAILLRTFFIPLFLICNYEVPGRVMPIVFKNEWIYWGIGAIFSVTAGWYSSLSMMYCKKSVDAEFSGVAGMIGGACLVSGIFIGIISSALCPIIVKEIRW